MDRVEVMKGNAGGGERGTWTLFGSDDDDLDVELE